MIPWINSLFGKKLSQSVGKGMEKKGEEKKSADERSNNKDFEDETK